MIKTPVIRIADWKIDQTTLKNIRKIVFIDEQHVPEPLEWDGQDEACTQFLASQDNQDIATARLSPGGQIGRMAVLSEYRRNKVGSILLKFIINYAHTTGLNRLYLHSQVNVLEFYKLHGFIADGEIFLDAGIKHREMYQNLC